MKIIIYDDDKDILFVTFTILKRYGYEVLCRENCSQLVTDLESFQPQLILMDNWMPDMNGVQAIQYIKTQDAFKNIPVIFFSANASVEDLAVEAGADGLLKKPFDAKDLQTMITKLVPA
ncbi:MAG: response regulator [Chitinophagaceae bacterium]